MSKFEQYNVVLKDLNNETLVYEYTLDEEYFKKIDSPEVQKGHINATVKAKKKNTAFELDFFLEGTILIPCDRCLDTMEQVISYKEKLQVKFGNKFSEEDEIVIVPESEGAINVAWFLYEFIVLNIPLKHVHAPGECNKTMATKLKRHITKSKDDDNLDLEIDDEEDFSIDDNQTDPRWDGLQSIIEPKNASEKPTTTGDFIVDEKNRAVSLTEEGHIKAEELFGVENLYSIENAMLSHSLDQALKANYIFQKDVDYVVKDDQIIIVDEFTGRLSEGRRFSEGLHQALEAKEKVAIQEESQTLADTTYQNYFRMYKKLSGMTGTAQTEATEFAQIYNLDVVSIPTNVPVKRVDKSDLIYKSEREKFEAVCEKIKYYHEKGQPVLVGTASIEKSEKLHKILSDKKIPHTVLNAKQHEKEGKIIADAGQKGAVTIATNMAGRGVDIKLTPEILALGGLAIIGTERHESRRIDNQLRGRSGRQGDVGESQFYLSLEDNLLRIFGSDRIKSIMERLGIKEGEFIESKMVTRAVENSQKKVEAMHFESRKHLLEYDDVANEQRKVIYSFRNDLLKEDYDISSKIDENRVEYVQNLLSELNITQALSEDEFDYEQLVARLKEELHFIVKIEDIKSEDYEALENRLVQILKDVYEQKMSKVGDKQKSEIERILYLQILDNAYREHLYAMDTLKTGIGLRGYNQKDPLVEYKKESYNMFIDLVSNIKLEIIKILFTIQLQSKEEQEALDKVKANMEKSNEHITTNLAQEAVKSSDKKIARNEVCPCGSGLKYKQCCGKSGPKRGLVAGI